MKDKTLFRLILLLLICSFAAQGHFNSYPKFQIWNQGVRINYSVYGKGDTTLFFVHGWCLNKTYWSNQVGFFSKRYRVVTIDLPGFGSSGKNRKDWSTAVYASDINTVINQLHLKKVILIGHSMAGDIALMAAIKNPVKIIGLVGVDNFKNSGHILTSQEIKSNAAAINEMRRNFKKVAYQYFGQSLFYKTTNPIVRKRILNDVARTDSIIAIKSLEGALNQMKYDESRSLLALKKKLYLINSDYIATDTSVFVSKRIPYQLFSIHASGHFPMIEKPTEFNLRLLQILKSI